MSKAYLNAIGEYRDFDECFNWLVKLDKELDELKGLVAKTEKEKRFEAQKFHGERVEARRKANNAS